MASLHSNPSLPSISASRSRPTSQLNGLAATMLRTGSGTSVSG